MKFKSYLAKHIGTFISLLSLSYAFKDNNNQSTQVKYKILMLLPFASESHRNCFLPLVDALANRGHQVVILSGLEPKSKHPNVKEINHGVDIMDPDLSMFEIREKDSSKGFSSFQYLLPFLAHEMYEAAPVRELYERKDEFDVMILDNIFNEPAYPFLAGKKYIGIDTAGTVPTSSAVLGNVMNPSFVPAVTIDFTRPYSFLQRIQNLLWHLLLPFYWKHYKVVPLVQKEISSRFPDLPPLLEIERNLSLILMNTHFSLDAPYPLLPSQVEIGCMHCKSGNELPKDLQSWIEGAGPSGVVYFSLGSICKGKTIPKKYKDMFVETFGKLKQRVIWKYEDDFQDLPPNVIIRKWLPQQDILAHPNVKLFMTHGGLLSMQESIFHETPLLAFPVFGDQERNAQKIENKGFGKFLIWEDLTVEKLEQTILSILEEPKYYETVISTSEIFRDQPHRPVEIAVWWTEYFIRHNGAPQLRSPGADLSWIEYLMLDVILVLHLTFFIIYWILKKIIKKLYNLTFVNNGRIKKKKE